MRTPEEKEVVVVNPVFIEPLVKLGIKRENIIYIPNFVDHEKFHVLLKEEIEAAKEKLGIPKDKFVITGCGQVRQRDPRFLPGLVVRRDLQLLAVAEASHWSRPLPAFCFRPYAFLSAVCTSVR